jgi:hypothetical protein
MSAPTRGIPGSYWHPHELEPDRTICPACDGRDGPDCPICHGLPVCPLCRGANAVRRALGPPRACPGCRDPIAGHERGWPLSHPNPLRRALTVREYQRARALAQPDRPAEEDPWERSA